MAVTRGGRKPGLLGRGKADLPLAIVTHSGYICMMVKELRAVRINERHLEELKKLAKKESETVSFLIQQAIREFLERKRGA
jgi:hypothetical protein